MQAPDEGWTLHLSGARDEDGEQRCDACGGILTCKGDPSGWPVGVRLAHKGIRHEDGVLSGAIFVVGPEEIWPFAPFCRALSPEPAEGHL